MSSVVFTDKCRICGEKKQTVMFSSYRTKFGESFSLRRCKVCSFVTVVPLPSIASLERYYDDSYWHQYKNKKTVALDALFKLRMLGILRKLQSLVPQNGKILDWGSGDGALLRLLRQYGFDCFGIDAYSAEPADSRIIATTIERVALPNEFFDAITCFHVLEHIMDPMTSVKKALNLLKTGGVMVLEVPNIGSLGFRVFKNKWQPLEIPTHLNHFTPETLQRLFRIIGNAQVIHVKSFSHRVSPSALVLSLLPFFSPKRVRQANRGHYPLVLMITYLVLQILAYPFAMMESYLGRGAVVRMYVKKIG